MTPDELLKAFSDTPFKSITIVYDPYIGVTGWVVTLELHLPNEEAAPLQIVSVALTCAEACRLLKEYFLP